MARLGAGGLAAVMIFAAGCSGATPHPDYTGLSRFSQRYGLILTWTRTRFPFKVTMGNLFVTGRDPSAAALEAYIPRFLGAFGRIPVCLVKRSGMTQIAFCENLTAHGEHWEAIDDFDTNSLYLDVARSPEEPDFQRYSMIHDYFHLLDYRMNGPTYDVDPDWAVLNAPGFHYLGSGSGLRMRDRNAGEIRDDLPGFLNLYQTTNTAEDKADLFANMINHLPMVEEHAARDRYLRSKVKFMEAMLRRVCPSMDDHYWDRIYVEDGGAGRRPY